MSSNDDRDRLTKGLVSAGLEPAEISAFLTYSDVLERELDPMVPAGAVPPGRAGDGGSGNTRIHLYWTAILAAVLLLGFVPLAWTLFLITRQNGILTQEKAQLAVLCDQRNQELARAHLVGGGGTPSAIPGRNARPVSARPSLATHDLWRILGERAVMGDHDALDCAKYLRRILRLAEVDSLEDGELMAPRLVYSEPKFANSEDPANDLLVPPLVSSTLYQ